MIIQLAGHPGSGKSTLAARLRAERGAVVLDLDDVKSPLLEAGMAWPEASGTAYEVLWSLLASAARPGALMVVDTPSYWPRIHERIAEIAAAAGVEHRFVECVAPAQERARRLAERPTKRSQVPAAGDRPAGAPEELRRVDERDIARPVGVDSVVLDTTGPVELDTVLGGTPRLVVISGWTGCGKSTLADAVAHRLGAAVVSADWLMSALRADPEVWPSFTDRDRHRATSFRLVSRQAESELRRGRSVVLDLVGRPWMIPTWVAMAEEYAAELRIVECTCSDAELRRARIEGRRRGIPDWYELDWDGAERNRLGYEPLPDPKLALDAADPFDAMVERAMRHVFRRAEEDVA